MGSGFLHGRLADAASAPAAGEVVERLLDRGGVRVEHILSGTLAAPVAYRQPPGVDLARGVLLVAAVLL
jgi:hypothetical protein